MIPVCIKRRIIEPEAISAGRMAITRGSNPSIPLPERDG